MKITGSLGVAVVIVLAGCATMHARSTQQEVRDVHVSMSGTDGCTIANDIADIRVTGKNNANIVWNVKPASGFKFTPNDGIKLVVKPGYGTPQAGQIANTTSSETTWRMHDKNTEAGHFGYEVNAVRKGGGTPCKLDPIIYNDGSCDPSGGAC